MPEKWSPEFNAFVARCLTVDPKRRPTAKELLIDPFMQKSKGPALLSELVLRSLEDIAQFRKGWGEDASEYEGTLNSGSVMLESGSRKKPAQGSIASIRGGLQTYMKANGTVQKQQRPPQEEGEYIDIYDGGGTIMIKEEKKEETASQGSVRIEKPEEIQQTG